MTDAQTETKDHAACTDECCDIESQPMFNHYTLIGAGALAALFGVVALVQALG